MPSEYLEDRHHLVRYVPWARLIKSDDDETVIGISGAAFRLRENEEYLSATWAEYFAKPLMQDNVEASIRAFRVSNIKVGAKSAFAVGNVQRIRSALMAFDRRVRFIHEPEADNPAHAALRGWPEDDDELFNRIASDEWSVLVLNKSIA